MATCLANAQASEDSDVAAIPDGVDVVLAVENSGVTFSGSGFGAAFSE